MKKSKSAFWMILIFGAYLQSCLYDKTNSDVPSITTLPTSNITSDSAFSGGSIIYYPGYLITARGVCWGTSSNPTVNDFKTVDGQGSGNFNSILTNLSAGTVYYLRAYAINATGIFYGNEISFQTRYQTKSFIATKDGSIFNNLAGDSPEKDYGSGGSQLLRVGYSASEDTYGRTLIQFDLSSIPTNATIDSVCLKFTAGKSGTNVQVIYVHQLLQSWTEGTTTEGCNYYGSCQPMGTLISSDGTDATWINTSNLSNPWNVSGGSFNSTASASSVDQYATPDLFTSPGLVEDVQSWVSSPSTNFGWLLKIDEPPVNGIPGALKRYVSKDAALDPLYPAFKPTLVVTYH